jgi:CRISPR-associated protein Cmr1
MSSASTEVKPPTTFDILHPHACKIWVVNHTFGSWEEALNTFGKSLQKFRNRRQPDYSTVKRALQGGQLTKTVERAAFGLPIVFRFTSLGNQKGTLVGEHHSRRASPLLIHVTRLANGGCAIVLTLFCAQFLPAEEKIMLKRKGPPAKVDAPDFKIIHNFLNVIDSEVGDLLEVESW